MNDEFIPICICCNFDEIGEIFRGDEGWTVCIKCGAIEQGYYYIIKEEYEELNK